MPWHGRQNPQLSEAIMKLETLEPRSSAPSSHAHFEHRLHHRPLVSLRGALEEELRRIFCC